MTMQKALIVMALYCLWGCSKEIDLNQSSYDSKIVVDGWIEQNQPAYIFLTKSSPYTSAYDSVSIRQSFLNYAKITLTSSKGEEEILTLYRQNQFFPPFVYKSVYIKGQIGVTYNINIEVLGTALIASTTIPSAPLIEAARYTAETDSTGYIEYKTEKQVPTNLYLFAQVKSKKADNSYHPPMNPMKTLYPDKTYNNWNTLWRSNETTLYSIVAQKDFYTSYPTYQYSKMDTVWLKIGAVDSISNQVLVGLFKDKTNNGNPFSFNGNEISSNIEGGIGRWTGIGTAPIIMVCGALQE